VAHLKCTKRLLARLDVTPALAEPDPAPVLGDWFANVIPVWGGELIICLNERSLLTVILPASCTPALGASLRERVPILLRRLAAPSSFIVTVQGELEHVAIVKTDSRSMLSHLRDLSGFCEDAVDLQRFNKSREEAEMRLADWLYGPSPYRSPIDLLREMIAAHEKTRS